MLEKQKTDVKDIWKILNEVINKRKNKPSYPEYFIKNNKRISKKGDIANRFNKFFTNIPLPKNYTHSLDYLEENIEHIMFLGPVDDLEIIRTVQNCKK